MNAPESVEVSTESLAAYLTETARTDRQKARAIYRWIAENIEYDVKGLIKGNHADATPEGVLKKRSSVCGGYSNLFERLANLSGLEAVTIGGYSKGYGYSPGMKAAKTANHAWNAVKIDGKWHLIDCTWGAGKVGRDGEYKKEFDDHYFFTSPEKFIFDHLPEDPYWQLLNEPISKEKFEDLVCLEPAFFDLGVRLGNQENVSIISNGGANITLYSPQDVSFVAELEMPAGYSFSRRIHGSPTFINRSGELCLIELLPPFPGEYILRIFARHYSDGIDEFEKVMEYRVVELSGSKRCFPTVSDQFYDLGFRLDDRINGTIVARGEANLTLDVPADVLMIASLEDAVQEGHSSTKYRNSIFVQRMENKYEISLLPPEPGEYILKIFAKRKSNSIETYPFVMAFNVSALSGSKQSFPEIFRDFRQMNAYLFAPLSGEIEAGSNQTFQIRIPEAMEVAVICGNSWNYLKEIGDIFQGNAIVERGEVDIAVRQPGTRDFMTILRYRAV